MSAGVFITLEGIEGVGKTTAVDAVVDFMRARGYRIVRTREPGGTPLGEKVRALLLDRDSGAMAPTTELLLMFAARAQHLAEIIRPALGRGDCVICDRFTDATYAYQGGGRGLDLATIAAAENLVHPDLQPQVTVLLDAPPALALSRAKARSRADRFEQEEVAFFERVRAAYLERARAFAERFLLVDASQDVAAVHAAIRAALVARLA